MVHISNLLLQAAAMTSLLAGTSQAAAVASDSSLNTLEKRRFAYRENQVTFFMPLNDPLIAKATFTIKDSSVTPGQDPEGRVSPGKVAHLFGQKFTFSVGRKKSTDVANFWNSQIAPNQNTFGYTAGELNFALIGDLQIDIPRYDGGAPVPMLFENIGLAQGSSGLSNNWWFGGKDCVRHDSSWDDVSCTGREVGTTGTRSVRFERGTSNTVVDSVMVRGIF